MNRIIKLVTNSISVSEMLQVVLVSFLQSGVVLESNYWTHVPMTDGRMPSFSWRRVNGVGQI